MAEFVRVCRLSEIPPGSMKGVKVRRSVAVPDVAAQYGPAKLFVNEILVANIDGQVYAIGDVCTHLRGRLHDGTLEGTVVECANHGAKFDVTDGGICSWVTHPLWYKLLMDATFPGFLKRSVPSYPTRVEGDDVYVQV